jgi:leucyl/phenylalanyl-tRNA---protein transferase
VLSAYASALDDHGNNYSEFDVTHRRARMNARETDTATNIIAPDFLLTAYANGYFPMADSRTNAIRWYSPDPRAILPLDRLHVARSLRQTIKKNIFRITLDTAFDNVIHACAEREETWISEEIFRSYHELHRLGFAHSVESWHGGRLVGGLYGVALHGAFFGESMFSRMRDASKVALAALVERLREQKFKLLDTQFITPHLASLGAIEIPRDEYLSLLKHALKIKPTFID